MNNRPTIVKPKVIRPSGLAQPKTRMPTAVGKATGNCNLMAVIYTQKYSVLCYIVSPSMMHFAVFKDFCDDQSIEVKLAHCMGSS